MTGIENPYKILLLTLVLLITGCSTVSEKAANPDKNKLGVLIVAGEGLNVKYSDVKDVKANSTWFITSQKVAESLHSGLEKENTKAQLYVNTNSNIDSRSLIGQLIAQDKRDGLIQVMIRHIKDTSENTVYLVLAYNTLKYGKNENGETLTFGNGVEERYVLLGKYQQGSQTPLTVFTDDFINKLSKAGYI